MFYIRLNIMDKSVLGFSKYNRKLLVGFVFNVHQVFRDTALTV